MSTTKAKPDTLYSVKTTVFSFYRSMLVYVNFLSLSALVRGCVCVLRLRFVLSLPSCLILLIVVTPYYYFENYNFVIGELWWECIVHCFSCFVLFLLLCWFFCRLCFYVKLTDSCLYEADCCFMESHVHATNRNCQDAVAKKWSDPSFIWFTS